MAKLKGYHLLDHELVRLVVRLFNINLPLNLVGIADANMKKPLLECEGLEDEDLRIIRMIEAALDWKGGHPALPIATENLWREDLELRAKGLIRA